MTLLIGADPELFIRKDGVFVSGHTIPCGTKKKPRQTQHGAVQNDGLALELNIPPADTLDGFVYNVRSVLDDLRGIVQKKDKSFEIVAQPTAPFSNEYLSSLPERVRELGCNLDYNAYTMDCNPPPDARTPFRTGAGHVHVGWTEGVPEGDIRHFYKCGELIRELDFMLGLPLLKIDHDDQRRKLYGQAGAFRPKSYGCEYRVPSNAWLSSEEHYPLVYNQVSRAVQNWQRGDSMYHVYGEFALDAIAGNVADWDVQRPDIAKAVYS